MSVQEALTLTAFVALAVVVLGGAFVLAARPTTKTLALITALAVIVTVCLVVWFYNQPPPRVL